MYCQCGCGRTTLIATRTSTEKGWVKGQHKRFINGHNTRKPVQYLVEDQGFRTPCWIWQLHVDRYGYGRKKTHGSSSTNVLAHRWYWEQANGTTLSPDVPLDHLCRTRACVNPEHLEPVTWAENQRRRVDIKLTASIAAEIRQLLTDGVSSKDLAARFMVDQSTISQIKHRKRWA